jgi:hypothetical protein
MRRFIDGADRIQQALLPHSWDDYVDEENPVRVIEVLIDELDVAALVAAANPPPTGRQRRMSFRLSRRDSCGVGRPRCSCGSRPRRRPYSPAGMHANSAWKLPEKRPAYISVVAVSGRRYLLVHCRLMVLVVPRFVTLQVNIAATCDYTARIAISMMYATTEPAIGKIASRQSSHTVGCFERIGRLLRQ